MLDSILGSLFGNKTKVKKVVSSNVSGRTKKRKLVIQKFKSVDPNDNLKRAKIAKELLGVSRTEGERKAARKFYKDEMELNNLKNKIKASNSINEKLSLARQGKRLAAKQQKEFWENLINKLQKRKQEKKDAVMDEKKALTTDTDEEQEMKKDTEEIKEDQGQDVDDDKSEKDSDSDIKESEEVDENEDEDEDEDEDKDEDEKKQDEEKEDNDNDDDSEEEDDIDNEDKDENLI